FSLTINVKHLSAVCLFSCLCLISLSFPAPLHAGAQCLEPENGASPGPGALDLPWQDELCCDSPAAHSSVEGGGKDSPGRNESELQLQRRRHCYFRSSVDDSSPHDTSGGTCLDIRCSVDENWGNLTCDFGSRGHPSSTPWAGLAVIRLQRLIDLASDNLVVCEVKNSFLCSVSLNHTKSLVTVVTVSIADAAAPPVLLRVPAFPVKPNPPVNLSHIQTIEGDLILQWDDPSHSDNSPLRYEVRYSSNATDPAWQMVSAPGEPRLSLDLKPTLNYTVQVRCSSLKEPPLWSEWSEAHHICLNMVSYIPEKVVVRPGENVTVYCVFNDRSISASTAMWMLNLGQLIPRSQYQTVSQRVSQITVHPSEHRMYHLLRCTQEFSIPYSQIYIEGAPIDINCETNGDIDAMDCSWTMTQWTKPIFRSKWADLTCDEMEERERLGEDVGSMDPECTSVKSRSTTCIIQPLRMNCYKLWLEMPSIFGPIKSKPVYVSPIDHGEKGFKNKQSVRGRVLRVTWEPPSLPAQGLQCQFRYRPKSVLGDQPEWQVRSSSRLFNMSKTMCQVYATQVRCMHTNGTGYWSEWSESVYSHHKTAERGPDFWRIRQDASFGNQTNVTLLFEHLPASRSSYCVDGYIVQHQGAGGLVKRQRIKPMSSYSFEWNQEPQTVTVEAYNSLGNSSDNMNMTLDRKPKRHCVRSFHVAVVNSTCVSLSWSLLDNCSVPLFMVVQWSPQGQQQSGASEETWARLPYTDRLVHLRGDFFSSEEYGFYLYPVFADGEEQPVFTLASRGDPAVYMMMMIISFLSIVLLVTLVLSQNQMKKFVWKDVPNPKKCSWARGLDFQKVDAFDHLFRPPEGLPAWPLLLPSEKISNVIVVDKTQNIALIQNPLVSLTPEQATAIAISLSPGFDHKVSQPTGSEGLLSETPSVTIALDALSPLDLRPDELQPFPPLVDQRQGGTDTSAQSSVTYATVLPSELNQDQQPFQLHDKESSGNSSSDEGNFSANNSDISGSFPGGLWELDSCRGGDMDDPRHSCSYNSVEEFSETSEQEDEVDVKKETELYYLGMDYQAEDEESEDEDEQQRREETKTELLKSVLSSEDCPVESHPLLDPEDSRERPSEMPSSFSSLYLPQFRTAAYMRQLATQKHDSTPQL
uniref:Leptin receptor n=1 Tax=Salarias fasciatus TaxID=181472 RepID=A0A672IC31_SALFA